MRGRAYENPEDGPAVEWSFIQCERCSEPSVQLREDFGLGNGFSDDDKPLTVFPAPPAISRDIPADLRADWQEAQQCVEGKHYTAAALMVRRLLESACAEQGVKKGMLAKKLAVMREEGRIDATLAEWADALRIVGNEGAHNLERRISREDAEDVLAFAEAFLDHIYVLRVRFERFRSRIHERRKPEAS